MERYTKTVRRGKRIFRYDTKNRTVQWVTEATDDDYADNERWQEKFGQDLWEIDENGMIPVRSVGLSMKNWEDKEARDSYLDMWNDDLDEELACLIDELTA